MTTVSAIIPTRDRAVLLTRSIASVRAQSRPVDELIVVDDGSRDDTALVAQRHGGSVLRYERIGSPGGPPAGVSAARNHGIRRATGNWLAFLDSDDEWLPGKIAAQLAALTSAADRLVCHTDEIWIRDGRRVNQRRRHRKRGGMIFRHCLPLCAMSPSSILIHRSVFERVGLFDEELPACEDYDLWLRICALYPVLYLDHPWIVKYGGHADQLSRTVEALDRFRIRALVKILDAGVLGEDDRTAALATLTRKVSVYATGAEKRGRRAEALALRGKLAEIQRALAMTASPVPAGRSSGSSRRGA